MTQNEQIEQLGRYIHTLRRQRGSALKIVVREQRPACARPMSDCCSAAARIW
jgi:hypothetical protein